MKYDINYATSVLVLPRDALLDKLCEAGETEIKFLIRFASDEELRGDYDKHADSLASELKCERSDVDSALAYWRGAGVISCSQNDEKKRKVARHSSLPSYTGEELSRIIDENGLSMIIDECQRITGRVFNATEINRIAALNSYLGLEPEFILLLFVYCANKGKTTLKYIEKTAYDLYDIGIDSTDKLEEHIKKEEQAKSLEVKLRKMFGYGDRALTPTEKKYFRSWSEELHYGEDIIREAFNITIEKTNKVALAYLNKILCNWYEHGYKTTEDVQNALMEYEKSKEKKMSDSQDSFDVDEFFELSLKRSRDRIVQDTQGGQ